MQRARIQGVNGEPQLTEEKRCTFFADLVGDSHQTVSCFGASLKVGIDFGSDLERQVEEVLELDIV